MPAKIKPPTVLRGDVKLTVSPEPLGKGAKNPFIFMDDGQWLNIGVMFVDVHRQKRPFVFSARKLHESKDGLNLVRLQQLYIRCVIEQLEKTVGVDVAAEMKAVYDENPGWEDDYVVKAARTAAWCKSAGRVVVAKFIGGAFQSFSRNGVTYDLDVVEKLYLDKKTEAEAAAFALANPTASSKHNEPA